MFVKFPWFHSEFLYYRYMHGSEFLWSTAMGCNFSFILVPSWVNFSNRYMYGWSKIVHRGTWMGLTSYTVVHGWFTFPSKLVHGWVMGGGTSKFPEAHPYPDQSWVPPPPPGQWHQHTSSWMLYQKHMYKPNPELHSIWPWTWNLLESHVWLYMDNITTLFSDWLSLEWWWWWWWWFDSQWL